MRDGICRQGCLDLCLDAVKAFFPSCFFLSFFPSFLLSVGLDVLRMAKVRQFRAGNHCILFHW